MHPVSQGAPRACSHTAHVPIFLGCRGRRVGSCAYQGVCVDTVTLKVSSNADFLNLICSDSRGSKALAEGRWMKDAVHWLGSGCRDPPLAGGAWNSHTIAASVEAHLKPFPRLQAQSPQAKGTDPRTLPSQMLSGHPTPSVVQEVENQSVSL